MTSPSGRKRSPRIRAYKCWRNMRQRCSNPAHVMFKNYGGRGITVCERWAKFENFLADMGIPPEGLTLERINNELGYSPENCRWATYTEQARNRRNTRMVTAFGKTQTLHHWEIELGLARGALYQRLKRGWNPEDLIVKSTRPSALISAAARRRASHV